jgi:hypothetical protein
VALGDRRAGDGALGRVAVRRAGGRSATLLALMLLTACHPGAQLTGIATGSAVGVVTASPAVGYLVGIGTAVAADELFKRIGRSRARAEQDAIATAAAPLSEGDAAPWHIRHTIPIGNERGEVRVVRVIATPLAQCREILFSVDDASRPAQWYATSICQQADGWHWALAEPAVERWGFLHR